MVLRCRRARLARQKESRFTLPKWVAESEVTPRKILSEPVRRRNSLRWARSKSEAMSKVATLVAKTVAGSRRNGSRIQFQAHWADGMNEG